MAASLIKIVKGSRAEFISANPRLASGELGLEVDTGQCKMGDGIKTYNSLAYIGDNLSVTDLTDTVNSIVEPNFLQTPGLPAGGRFLRVPPGTVSTSTMGTSTLRLAPFYVPVIGIIDRLGAEVTTGVVGSTFRMGIYADNGFFNPDFTQLLGGNATIDGNSVAVQQITVNIPVSPGWYWIAGVSQGGDPTMRAVSTPFGLGTSFYDYGSTLPGAGNLYCYTRFSVTGSLPTSGTYDGLGGSFAAMFIRLTT